MFQTYWGRPVCLPQSHLTLVWTLITIYSWWGRIVESRWYFPKVCWKTGIPYHLEAWYQLCCRVPSQFMRSLRPLMYLKYSPARVYYNYGHLHIEVYSLYWSRLGSSPNGSEIYLRILHVCWREFGDLEKQKAAGCCSCSFLCRAWIWGHNLWGSRCSVDQELRTFLIDWFWRKPLSKSAW